MVEQIVILIQIIIIDIVGCRQCNYNRFNASSYAKENRKRIIARVAAAYF